MSEQNGLNRRQFLTKGGLAVAGATLAVSGLGALLTACSPEEKPPAVVVPTQPEVPKWPFTWTKLDASVVEERAYKKYGEAG